ncbi:MAG: hypothetical protein GY835_21125 [bacterium]|nr:hypothetical protein [bacterium]
MNPMLGLIFICAALLAFLAFLRDRSRRDYMQLIDRLDGESGEQAKRKLMIIDEHKRNNNLRRGILALIMGAALSIIPLATGFITDDSLADTMIVVGILIVIYAIATFIIWLLVDRKHPPMY